MSNLSGQTQAMLTLINNYRAQNGAPPLQISPTLTQASQWMANDMATNNYLSHTDSLGRDPFTRMDAFGYTSQTLRGENVAAGDSDAQSTFNSWLDACDPSSSGVCTYAHRSNIINPGFLAIGIGEAYNPNSTYQYYWTTDFGGVVDTGATGAAPPTVTPTIVPTTILQPSAPVIPTTIPTLVPTSVPTAVPVGPPTAIPSLIPSTIPTTVSAGLPSAIPTGTQQTPLQPGIVLNGQCFCPTTTRTAAPSQFEILSTPLSNQWIVIIILVVIVIAIVLLYQNRSYL